MRAARFAAFASMLLFLALAGAASAAVRAVDISGFAFAPQSVTIAVGDTVTWTNKDAAAHSARVAGVGTTPTLSQGQSGSLNFITAGTFNYDCGIHGASMTGTVVVRAAATPPPTAPPPTAPPPTAPPPTAPPPTLAPTPAPTVAPTPSPSPTTSAAATSTPSPTATPSIAVVVPTEQPPAPAAADDGGSLSPLVVGGAVLALIAVAFVALTRIRR
jgi:plastocyanin